MYSFLHLIVVVFLIARLIVAIVDSIKRNKEGTPKLDETKKGLTLSDKLWMLSLIGSAMLFIIDSLN